jgi:hypothetical protein
MKNKLYLTLIGLLFSTSAFATFLGDPVNIKNGGTGVTTIAALTAELNTFTALLAGTCPASGGGTTNFLRADGTWAAPAASGSVTSVGFADTSTTPIYTITNSPVTTSGTIDQTLNTQSANSVFAGPTSGGAVQPSFRSLVAADIPSLSATYLPLAGGTMTGNIGLGTSAISKSITNEGSTGTTVNKLAKLTGAPSTAIIAATTDTNGIIGIVSSGAGTSGNAQVIQSGIASCAFDGATTAGHYVQISPSVAGDCTDAGAAYPASGQILGRVLSTNGSAGAYNIDIFPAEIIGPPVIATSQSPTARYHASSTGISGSLTTVSWTTQDWDSAGAMSSGVYTCPQVGYFQVNAEVTVSGTFALNSTLDFQLQKNGSVIAEDLQYAAAAVTNMRAKISDVAYCSSISDTLQFQVSTSATGPAIVSSNSKNYVSINFLPQSYATVASGGFIQATGGTITHSGNYEIHTFTTSGTFTVTAAPLGQSLTYVIVAGGGGGGISDNGAGGGGGAGGYLTGTYIPSVSPYTITVGALGAGGVSGAPSVNVGQPGGNSSAFGQTAIGGGGGGASIGSTPYVDGYSGGSGGGGSYYATSTATGGSNTVGQGNVGGSGGLHGVDASGGGGGGSSSGGGNGGTGGTGPGGAGGSGTVSPISSNTYAAGGGGGAASGSGGGAGGSTCGGHGGATGSPGSAATGYGCGGGGGGVSGVNAGGAGSPGIVEIMFQYQ